MRAGRNAVTVAALIALLAAGAAAPARAADDPSGSPSTAASADPALVAEAEQQLADDRATLEAAEITDAMRADGVFDLRADDSTFELDPDDSTVTLEKKRATKSATVVTLTSDLLFAFDKAALTPQAKDAVAALAAKLPQGATVRVDGYTDSIGTDARNLTLSKRRGHAVAGVLGAARPDLTLKITGHGEADPVAENEVGGKDNPVGRALNRRVELTYATG